MCRSVISWTRRRIGVVSAGRGPLIVREPSGQDCPIRVDYSAMSIDQQTHLPPQNLEAEQSVLGAMMVSERALDPVILEVRLEEEDFYRERHRLVFRMIKKLMDDREAVDALTVAEALAPDGQLEEAGGKGVVTELATERPGRRATRCHYAKIVKAERAAAAAAHRLADDPAAPSSTARASRAISSSAPRRRCSRSPATSTSSDFHVLADILEDEIDAPREARQGRAAITGTPSGLRATSTTITRRLPAGQPDHPRRPPSMGKSALVATSPRTSR